MTMTDVQPPTPQVCTVASDAHGPTSVESYLDESRPGLKVRRPALNHLVTNRRRRWAVRT